MHEILFIFYHLKILIIKKFHIRDGRSNVRHGNSGIEFFWTEGVFFLIVLNEEEILHNSTD